MTSVRILPPEQTNYYMLQTTNSMSYPPYLTVTLNSLTLTPSRNLEDMLRNRPITVVPSVTRHSSRKNA